MALDMFLGRTICSESARIVPAVHRCLNLTENLRLGEQCYLILKSGLAFARHTYLRTLSSYFVMFFPRLKFISLYTPVPVHLWASTRWSDVCKHIPILFHI
jgi:hypothetical protein